MDLPLRGFMKCLFKNDLSPLAVGHVTDEQLSEAWAKLFEQYASLTGNTQYIRLMDAMREYIRITGKLIVAEAGLSILVVKYDRDAVNNIKKIGYLLNFDPKNRQEYEKNINKLLSNCKTLRAKAEQQLSEIDKIRSESAKQKGGSESDFMDGITIISRHMGFRIDINSCSAGEYAGYQKQYNDFVMREMARNKQNK